MSNFLIYGSYGYTGRLIVDLAVERGLRPVLAGRDGARLAEQARNNVLEYRPFRLGDLLAEDAALQDVAAVLHCAGPFVNTSRPMVDACLRNGVHYLDITGEIAVFEALAARSQSAAAAGVMLLPGVGFDVVPTDCLAAHLKRRLPSAASLELAFLSLGGASRGTATSGIENLPREGMVRRAGTLVEEPLGARTRQVDFGRGPRTVYSIPWGDVATAYYTTGIPDITTYARFPETLIRLGRLSSRLAPLTRQKAFKSLLKTLLRLYPEGPSESVLQEGRSIVWGRVVAPDGSTASARLEAPNAYTLTAYTALEAARRASDGKALPGFHTPAQVFGPDYVLEFPGVTRADLSE